VVGTVFGGLIGNLIGGAIEDTSMRIPKGILRYIIYFGKK